MNAQKVYCELEKSAMGEVKWIRKGKKNERKKQLILSFG